MGIIEAKPDRARLSPARVDSLVAENLFLKLSKVPEFPFLDTPFPLTVHVSDDKGRLPSRLEEISFTLKLVDSSNHLDDYSHILSPLSSSSFASASASFPSPAPTPAPAAPCLYSFNSQNGRCFLQLQFTSLSSECDGRSFVLLAQLHSSSSSSPHSPESGTVSCVSSPMTPVRYQLRCECSPSSPSSSPSVPLAHMVWFKDRGGKGNCVKVPVRLVSSTGENVLGLQVPLVVQLIYSNGDPVADQSILELKHESRPLTVGSTGERTLRVRIKEVSQRHKGKFFALRISPDLFKDPNTRDISPAVSFTIDVRSKTSNSAITSSLSPAYSRHLSSSSPAAARPSADSSRQKRQLVERDCDGPATPFTVSAIGSFAPHGAPSSWSRLPACPPPSSPQQQQQQPPDLHRHRKSPKATASSSPSQQQPSSHFPSPLPLFSSTSLLSTSSLSSDLDAEIPPLSQQSSMTKIELWAYSVAHELENMKWRLIGQEVCATSRGSSSSSSFPAPAPAAPAPAPLYEMSNPNARIEMLLSQFRSLQSEENERCSSCQTSRPSDSSPASVSSSSHTQGDSEEEDKDDDFGFSLFSDLPEASFPLNSLSLCSLSSADLALWE